MVAGDMVAFWEGLRNASRAGSGCAPRMVWKHTIAPAGGAREMKSNPQKMEVYNRLMVGTLLEAGGGGSRGAPQRRPRKEPACPRPFQTPVGAQAWEFLDTFDMTFPFHFTNEYSDGGHYGRWACDGSPQHRCDSVDLMVLQVLLNMLCSADEVA